MNDIKAIIFDLDDTLFETTKYLLKSALNDSFATMIRLGLDTNLNKAFHYFDNFQKNGVQNDIFQALISEFGIKTKTNSHLVYIAGKDRFYNREIPEDIYIEKDVLQTLKQLNSFYHLHLITAGIPRTQLKKIKVLKLDKIFPSYVVVDIAKAANKGDEIISFAKQYSLEFSQILVVGDRIDNEILYGNRLGCKTCRILKGHHSFKKICKPEEKPDVEILQIKEILQICQK